MRHFYSLLLGICCVISSFAQSSLPFFSDLSGQFAHLPTFDAVAWGDDLYYYINDGFQNQTILYKVDNTGSIVSTRPLDTGFSHSGNFVQYNDRLFFDGLRFSVDGRDRVLLEFNTDLEVIMEQSWPVLPENASMMIYNIGDGMITFDRGARMIRNDTLFSVMPYALTPAFIPYTQYEVLGLDGTVYFTKFMKNIDSLSYHTYTTIGPDAFYLFGYMKGPTAPGGDSFGDGGLIGRFNLASGVVEGTTWFNDPFLGNGTSGSVGQLLNNRLYSSSYTFAQLQEAEYAGTGCPEETVVIEARTPDLTLIKGYNLPVCGFGTNGGRSFATDADGFIYYANYNGSEGLTYVFKFDSLLNLVWQKKYAIAFPYSILTTPEGYLVLNCITSLLQPILQIHRIGTQNGDVVSTTELPFSTAGNSLAFYPNPFNSAVQTNLSQAATGRLLVYNQQGQLVADVAPPYATKVDLSHLPAGVYLFDMKDAATGQPIGQQWMVKQ